MDVGNPNNFPALARFMPQPGWEIRAEGNLGHGATDEETLTAMKMLH